MTQLRNYLLAGLLAASAQVNATFSIGEQPPVCPGQASTTFPAYSSDSDKPTIVTWSDLEVLPQNCHITLDESADTTVAFAGIFTGPQSIDEIALLMGAVSNTQGLRYWSVTDRRWRKFITDAYAIESLQNRKKRQDFSAQEITSKTPLYFAQNDSRSWGLNIYSIEAIDVSADAMTISTSNETPVKLGPLTVFKTYAAQSVVFITRRSQERWEYYSLSVVKDSVLPVNTKSLINRQASLYRLLTGQSIDMEPPLAP